MTARLAGAALAAAALAASAARSAEPPADTVLRSGAVYTQDGARSRAQALAIRDGRIVFVGSDLESAVHAGPATRVVNLAGAMVLPGFQDAHIHPISGVELLQCDLNDLPDREAILARVERCVVEQPGEWVVGSGWGLVAFPGGAPRKEALDAISGERPIYLASFDEHSAWVNSEALRRAGISAETPDPPNGRIERDPGTGEPSGTLREKAMGLVRRHVPPPSREMLTRGLLRAIALLNEAGVTAVQEVRASREDLEVYRGVERSGRLTLRVRAAFETDPLAGPEQVDDMVRLRETLTGERLRLDAGKIFLDGVIEARTAAMLEPYLDTGERGEPRLDPDALQALVDRLVAERFSVHIHAIGDRAVRIALDAIEAAGPPARRRELRHQLAHVQVIHPEDVPRFRRLGAIATFQPLWAYPDSYVTELTWPALGPGRSRWMYPIASVVGAGGPIAFGSDWTVSSLRPLDGIQVAVTRRDPGDPEGAVMQPEQRIDLPTALAAYTIGAAWANRLEEETGSLEVGKRADLVVLEHDLFERPPGEIAGTSVRLTLLEGEPVYRAPDFPWPAGVGGGEATAQDAARAPRP